jgi:hypothetical protein
MFISSSGNVGINKLNPSYQLHVSGTINLNDWVDDTLANNTSLNWGKSIGSNIYFANPSSGVGFKVGVGIDGTSRLILQSNNTILAPGVSAVGLGLIFAPTAQLHITSSGNTSATALFRIDSSERRLLDIKADGSTTLTGSFGISGSLTLDIPGKANNYVLKSDNNGGATWDNIYNIIGNYIYTGSVTASVNITPSSIFSITSGSKVLLRMNDSGTLVLPSYTVGVDPFRYAFISSGSANTGMHFYGNDGMIFNAAGANAFKIFQTRTEITNNYLAFSAQAAPANIYAQSDDLGTSGNNLTLAAGTTTKTGSIQLLSNVLITNTYFPSGSGYRLAITGSGVSGSLNVDNVLLVSSSYVTINTLLTLPTMSSLPVAPPTGTIASSGSGANCKIYFFNGTWNALF